MIRDVATSLKSQGFKDIVMVADSGGNPPGMIDVANEAECEVEGRPGPRVLRGRRCTEDIWSYDYLKQIGIVQTPDVRSATRWDIHDDYHYEALVALQDPKLIHAEQRLKAKKFSIYGVEIGSVQKMRENGRKLADYRATITLNVAEKGAGCLLEAAGDFVDVDVLGEAVAAGSVADRQRHRHDVGADGPIAAARLHRVRRPRAAAVLVCPLERVDAILRR